MIFFVAFFLIGAVASFLLARFVLAKYPAVGQFIEIDYQGKSVRLHYLDSSVDNSTDNDVQAAEKTTNSPKPTLILIHGATGNLHDFKASIFDQLSEKYRVIAFDRPGLGYSQRPRHGDSTRWCSPQQQMQIIRSAIHKLNIKQPFILGHSLAGPIVLDYMMQHGDELAGSILLSPVSHPWPNGVTWYNYLDRLPVIKELFVYSWLPILGAMNTSAGLKKLFFPEALPADYREKTAIDLFFRPRVMLDNFRDQRLLCEYVALAGRGYRSITTPTQLITGTDDDVVHSWLHAEKLTYELQQVDWLDMPNLGHSPHHGRTKQVIDSINTFVDKHS